MPRTKVPKKASDKLSEEEFKKNFKEYRQLAVNMKNALEAQMQNEIRTIENEFEVLRHTYKNILHIPLGQLMNKDFPKEMNSLEATAKSVLDSTNQCHRSRRSRSLGNDEGKHGTTNRRITRSLSRPKLKPNTPMSKYKTPTQQRKLNTFGTVTPKIKPNAPQIILRRPNMGETAISLQGSPLMVNQVCVDQQANLNIPLDDGRIFTIQPQRGLRISQIPNIDTDMMSQLQALRENLNKICHLPLRRE